MARTQGIDQPRYAKWVSVSHSVMLLEPELPIFIQGLGKLDARLVHEDAVFRALPKEQRGSPEESIKLTDRFIVSTLWVLGAYEVIRTLSQRVRQKPKVLTKRLAQQVVSTKNMFERVRIPLAKMEPAKRYKATDSSLARPAMHRDMGISWRVAAKTVIPRRRLSDRLLKLLTVIQDQQDRKAKRSR